MKFIIQRLPIILVIACSVALTGMLVFVGLQSPDLRKASDQESSRLNYVLVNEDEGAEFNDKSYNLGRDFVSLISQDGVNRWQTTSRSVAESGFRKGDYDAYVMIPQNFSAKLLSLESPDPERAQVAYRVKAGQNEVSNRIIRQKVGDILNGFNQKIVQMYFSSIIGNLAEAQRNVTAMVTGQQNIQATLTDKVQEPFRNLPETFGGVVGDAELLERQNESWQTQQEEFSAQTQNLLEESASEIDGQAEQLRAYTALQDLIGQLNRENAQGTVDEQAESDRESYRRLYDSLHETGQDQLDRFFTVEDGEQSGALAVFKAAAREFSFRQKQRIEGLQGKISDLERQAGDLARLRGEVAQRYFADMDKTPENVTDDDVKKAILNLTNVADDSRPRLPEAYLALINSEARDFPVEDVRLLVRRLYDEKLIARQDYEKYCDELDVIVRYRADEGLDVPAHGNFIYRDGRQEALPAELTYTPTVTLAFGTDEEQTLQFQALSGAAGKVASIAPDPAVATELQKRLREELSRQGIQATVDVKPEGSTFRIKFSPSQGASSPAAMPAKVAVTFSPALKWKLSPGNGQEYEEARYRWIVNGDRERYQNDGTVSYYHPDNGLKEGLPEILRRLGAVDRVSQSIATVFGSPSQKTVDVGKFRESLEFAGNKDKNIRDLAADSVYRSYEVISLDEKKDLISGSLVGLFKEQGIKLYREVDGNHRSLREAIGSRQDDGSFKAITASMTPPDYFLREADRLERWYFEAQQSFSESYAAWKDNPAFFLSSKEYDEYATDEERQGPTVYFEKKTAEELNRGFKAFAEGSRDQVTATKGSAAKIESLGSEFESMTKQTEATKRDAENILRDMNGLAEDSGAKTKDNKEYSTNFNTVMGNATQGGGSGKVFNFLSSPLSVEGKMAGMNSSSAVPYFMTIMGALIALACGYGIKQLDVQRTAKGSERLLRKSRAWRNAPNTLFSVTAASVLSAVFSVLTLFSVSGKNGGSWAFFVFSVTMASVLLFTYLWRQFPKTAIYVIGGFIGVYLLLTPILGMSIEPGSLIDWVFRLSPLQNVENGYAALLGGSTIGWFSVAALVGAAALGGCLNLAVSAPGKGKIKA